MNIAILTITGGENFGNRLQNYALQETLKKYGQVETIKNYTKAEDNYKTSAKIKATIKEVIGLLSSLTCINNTTLNDWNRKRVFKKFNNKYILFSHIIVSKDRIPDELNEKYHFFVSGSDQVWNPHYSFNSHIDFLDFASEQKRISYAASFGVNSIPEHSKENYKKWIMGIEYLSVREEQGKNIVYELTGRNAEVLIDPTLLLTKKDWKKISKKPKWLNYKEYILVYCLGMKSEEVQKSIDYISVKNNLPVIKLNDATLKKEYSVSPEEFIYLVENSRLLCTDSFHGTIFAYQMDTPVLICQRQLREGEVGMNSRMVMLEKLLGVSNRVSTKLDISDTEKLFSCDYTQAHVNICQERKKAFEFLRNALDE